MNSLRALCASVAKNLRRKTRDHGVMVQGWMQLARQRQLFYGMSYWSEKTAAGSGRGHDGTEPVLLKAASFRT